MTCTNSNFFNTGSFKCPEAENIEVSPDRRDILDAYLIECRTLGNVQERVYHLPASIHILRQSTPLNVSYSFGGFLMEKPGHYLLTVEIIHR